MGKIGLHAPQSDFTCTCNQTSTWKDALLWAIRWWAWYYPKNKLFAIWPVENKTKCISGFCFVMRSRVCLVKPSIPSSRSLRNSRVNNNLHGQIYEFWLVETIKSIFTAFGAKKIHIRSGDFAGFKPAHKTILDHYCGAKVQGQIGDISYGEYAVIFNLCTVLSIFLISGSPTSITGIFRKIPIFWANISVKCWRSNSLWACFYMVMMVFIVSNSWALSYFSFLDSNNFFLSFILFLRSGASIFSGWMVWYRCLTGLLWSLSWWCFCWRCLAHRLTGKFYICSNHWLCAYSSNSIYYCAE